MSCGDGEVGIVGKRAVKTFVYRPALLVAGRSKDLLGHVIVVAFAVTGIKHSGAKYNK